MQFLSITTDTTLSDLIDIVGNTNIDTILNANYLTRTVNVGQQFYNKQEEMTEGASEVTWEEKVNILNTLTMDSDVYEKACLQGGQAWKVFRAMNTFTDMIYIPEEITINASVDTIGNGEQVSNVIYTKSMECLINEPHEIDPAIFNEYSSIRDSSIADVQGKTKTPFELFNLPWGKITFYSSLADSAMDIPCYPEEISDGRGATYDTNGDMLYQYEPWQVYQSSGPRTLTFKFELHRDMWTGDHRDGRCNELIRFIQANVYPEYKGAAVYTATCTLYINGSAYITGIVTDVSTDWSGPIGQDGFYLYCELSITMTEVSKTALNYDTVRAKALIS